MSSVGYDDVLHTVTITYGSQDSDIYTFDGNAGRMTNYQFNLGTGPTTDSGSLQWNPNGTLAQLQITDHVNPADSQTCKYSYDDLGRLINVDCGTDWSQAFSFDPFGNINKAGNITFNASYDSSTNRIQSLPGVTVTYDTNGNLTGDGSHTYSWDAEGRPTAIDSVALTYDALGRMAEQGRSGSYTQIVYSPTGDKFALMTGTTLSKAFVPLPLGGTAVYDSTGLQYYRHADWLGSSRLSTTSARLKYYDTAYAPYGEKYDGSGTVDVSFTGQNQDTITGNYDFLFRQYSPVQGRWVSPDPAGLTATDATSPQSWNRYAYVMNSPTTLTDSLGLDPPGPCPYNDSRCAGWTSQQGGMFSSSYVGLGSLFDGGCDIDGVPASCGQVDYGLQNGSLVDCPLCVHGQIVGLDNTVYGVYANFYRLECNGSMPCENTYIDYGIMPVGTVSSDPSNETPDNLGPGNVIIRPSNADIGVRMRTPTLVSCAQGEKQYVSITIDNARTIRTTGVFNVTSGISLVGRPTAAGPFGKVVGTLYQYFYTTTGGLMTLYASGMSINNASFRVYARPNIQCK